MALFPNLSQWGDQGDYSTDPSTWGFTSGVGSISRSSTYFIGSPTGFSLRFKANDAPFGGASYYFDSEVKQKATLVAGKTYHIRLKVYTPSTDLIASNGVVFTLVPDAGIPGEISSAIASVSTATNNWSLVELKLTAQSSGNHTFNLYLKRFNLVDDINLNASFYVEQFYISEYVDTPPDPCTLAIDVPGTVIVDESAPAAGDGSITVAVTGAVGTIEYSNNNGASWQLSNVFAGLNDGIYQVRVREQATPSCDDYHSFAVNPGVAAFDFTTIVTHETISGEEDGIIEITPSGTGAPFTYSKDAGVGYQAGNVFSGLAAGTYTIAVKDSGGIVVAKNVTVNPGEVLFEKIYFSKNPIEYVVPKIPLKPKVHNDVRVEIATGTSIYLSQLKSELEPINNLAKFSLRAAFRGVLSANAPTYNFNTITRLTDRIKLYKNYYGGLDVDETTPISILSSNPFLVILGGIDKLRFPTINYFTDYLPTHKKFLTWAPLEKEVQRQQEDYLNFWVYGLYVTSLKLHIKAYYDDGTDETSTIITQSSVKYGQLYQIPAGPSNSGVFTINPAKNLIKYELWLTDQSDSIISEVRTYRLAPFSHPLTRYFMFLNSLGTYEVLYFKGQAEITSKVIKDMIQKHLASDYNSLQGEFEVNNPTIRDEGNYSSGYFKGPYANAWKEYMKDFLLSPRVYELKGQIRKPINVISDSFQYKVDQDYRHFVQFRTVESYENESYTPDIV